MQYQVLLFASESRQSETVRLIKDILTVHNSLCVLLCNIFSVKQLQ